MSIGERRSGLVSSWRGASELGKREGPFQSTLSLRCKRVAKEALRLLSETSCSCLVASIMYGTPNSRYVTGIKEHFLKIEETRASPTFKYSEFQRRFANFMICIDWLICMVFMQLVSR